MPDWHEKRNGKLYNSTVFWGRDGRIKDVYHKIHLAGDESEIFTPGQTLHTIDTEFGHVGTAVCWDMQFPEMARNLAKMGTDLIVCPTWGWEWIYGPARAYENGIFVAAAMAVPYWMPIEDLRRPSMVDFPGWKDFGQKVRLTRQQLCIVRLMIFTANKAGSFA